MSEEKGSGAPAAGHALPERTPGQQRQAAAETYTAAGTAAHELARVLYARAGAILAADHGRSLLLAHDMLDAFNAMNTLMRDAQWEHGKSLRVDRANFLAMASGPAGDAAPAAPKEPQP